ncbi:MAG: archease [Acidobacteriota bacterium]|nr:archease [Acidobacteriota bacterium]
MGFRILDHTADIGIEVEAAEIGHLFADAARGFASCVTDLTTIEARHDRHFAVSSQGLDNLMVDWLDELLYTFEIDGQVFSQLDVDVLCAGEKFRLEARAAGEHFDPERHPLKVPIKAVTYHELKVWRDEKGVWKARVIFDI